ncbi:hypothetical protein COU62_01670 [Candidatus Pacearchaeota archaeon CG10_big_fil_rev_8_21_14_0_10_35_219]|nr:hypothetical protein [Candidatus Pacearchaeota archaeon]OIO43143.1 MAG: hypothetical protein AUJ63_00945 [Candidatus Pacearchaeota archaeon CG1_02_35_32]PIO08072.1 MAG: hypothetical protein COU62_01670 [Candidatus Pacearchaeota archaeon CG10_big_fil_rev_8_21_14_0_10_35_219]PIY81585.1 MAG: hypothetical protein COY79_02505 [Candidatus Pacearchaeota archaeon CG_4_10_14_0_8_um_filter_35_169]PIZ78960.1 MAG: hypothetical protein COY00_04890 [Candidatus Pacearchaeota archaeon CG_4_10_14_0_2_um_filt
MPKKREVNRFSNLHNIIVFIILLIIPLTFFILKASVVPEESLGFVEIAFALVIAIVSTLFILWDKSFIITNPYLGTITGLLVLAVFDSAVFYRYKGPYTTFFVSLTSILVLIYVGFYFIKGLKNTKRDEENYYDEKAGS